MKTKKLFISILAFSLCVWLSNANESNHNFNTVVEAEGISFKEGAIKQDGLDETLAPARGWKKTIWKLGPQIGGKGIIESRIRNVEYITGEEKLIKTENGKLKMVFFPENPRSKKVIKHDFKVELISGEYLATPRQDIGMVDYVSKTIITTDKPWTEDKDGKKGIRGEDLWKNVIENMNKNNINPNKTLIKLKGIPEYVHLKIEKDVNYEEVKKKIELSVSGNNSFWVVGNSGRLKNVVLEQPNGERFSIGLQSTRTYREKELDRQLEEIRMGRATQMLDKYKCELFADPFIGGKEYWIVD